MKIAVTGGLGFIGSHTVVELQNKGYDVVVVDNLSNSKEDVIEGIMAITGKRPYFERMDLRYKSDVSLLFQRHPEITGIIHFAASKAVNESVNVPLLYYENNISALVYLLQEAVKTPKINFIFSSSCTVYGQADKLPITENAPIKKAESPYGNTKQIGEAIIKDTCKAYGNMSAIALRYFNPIGAHHSSHIGELPIGIPQNLIPYITQTAAGIREQLSVFGDDYPTPDGTCIRDYIHVVDLAKAHIAALERLENLKNKASFEVFNVGTGKGNSIYEVIKTFENVSQTKLNYKVVGRRAGDIISAYADTSKINTELGWKAETSLEDALLSAWKWQLKIKPKY